MLMVFKISRLRIEDLWNFKGQSHEGLWNFKAHAVKLKSFEISRLHVQSHTVTQKGFEISRISHTKGLWNFKATKSLLCGLLVLMNGCNQWQHNINNDLITAAFAAELTLHHVLHTPCKTNGVGFTAQYQQWSDHSCICIWTDTTPRFAHAMQDKWGRVYSTISTMPWSQLYFAAELTPGPHVVHHVCARHAR